MHSIIFQTDLLSCTHVRFSGSRCGQRAKMPSMAGKNLRREEVFKVIESSFENVDSFLELHKVQ